MLPVPFVYVVMILIFGVITMIVGGYCIIKGLKDKKDREKNKDMKIICK